METMPLNQRHMLRILSRWFLLTTLAIFPLLCGAEERSLEAGNDDSGAPRYDETEMSDPFEGWNRGIFWFNNQMDRYLLEPVADGYDAVVPDPMQRGVRNVFENLAYPRYLVSDLVQLKFGQAAEHTGRFLVNSTLGLGGLIDVAKHLGWERHSEDFGTALGHHGVPTGPYVVIPFLGPSNMRDGFSRIVDNFLSPVPWIAAETSSDNDAVAITLGMTALDVIQTRADLDEAINAAQEASLDYYLFIQSAYAQRRFAVIHDLQIEDSPTALENEADPFAEDEAFDEAFAGEGGYGLGNE